MSPFSLFRKKGLTIRPIVPEDVEELRFVGQEAWSDLASRDVGRKIKYPMRPRKIIEGYIEKEPQGCLVAEKDGSVIGAAYSHVWGTVGWIGPFEVLPEHQNMGVGGSLLAECERFLWRRGVNAIGLETMSHIPKNLHFYLSHAYSPKALTVITDKTLVSTKSVKNGDKIETGSIREVNFKEIEEVSGVLKKIGDSIYPGLDLSPELDILFEKRLGTVFVWESGGSAEGVALLHTYQKSDDANYSSIKLLVIDPISRNGGSGLLALLGRCEAVSHLLGKERMYARYPILSSELYALMARNSYSIRGANIRFLKGAEYLERGTFNLTSWAG
ncbi:MAG: GNAT family N-acetyltransferase [Methanomassiliicoccales archaeon]|nr:GNAT family N-acetyltransferase [Methanomassiliicoccales archaeon]